MELGRMDKLKKEPPFSIGVVIFVWALFTFSILNMSITFSEALRVKHERQPTFTKITFKDKSTYITSDSVIYVEHLEKYTILYDLVIDEPKIISNDQIMEIEAIDRRIKK